MVPPSLPMANRTSQIKPFNFLLTAFVDVLGQFAGDGFRSLPASCPWTPDPREWLKLTWIDRYSGGGFEFERGVIRATMVRLA